MDESQTQNEYQRINIIFKGSHVALANRLVIQSLVSGHIDTTILYRHTSRQLRTQLLYLECATKNIRKKEKEQVY